MALTLEKLNELFMAGKINANLYRFYVDARGHLMLEYTGNTAPEFAINAEGHLTYTFGEG